MFTDNAWSNGVICSSLVAMVMFTGCSRQPEQSLSDQDLRQRHHQCRMTSVLNTDQAVECKKIRRLCSERQARGETVCVESQ